MGSTLEKRMTEFIKIASYGALLISIIIMLNWIFAPQLIKTLIPESATMKFNTALLFAALSLYIVLCQQNRFPETRLQILPLGILLIAGATVAAYHLQINLFLDELFVPDPFTAPDAYPGRMSEMTAILFILLAMALLIIRPYPRLAEWIAIVANLISLLAVLAFLFNFESLYSIPVFSTISIFTAILFVILSVVIIISIPQSIIRNLVLLNQPAGTAIRWLLPSILVIPTLLSWIILQGMRLQLYEATFALVLLTVLTVSIQLLMVITYTFSIQLSHQKQQSLQRQLLQNELRRELDSLELKNLVALNTMKEEFFVMLSHDMRTPITSIVTSSDIMLQYNDKLTEDRRLEHLRKIKHQAFSVLDFVDDMTLLSHFQLGQIPYSPVNDDLAAFCREYCVEFQELTDLQKHELLVEIPDKVIEYPFDHKLIKRLLSNLIGNALKYSPDGGTIILHVDKEQNLVNLWVKDQGMGIPETELSTLFELFHRATNVENIKGYGLGLAIVKQIVAVHNATISVKSKVGEGSTFAVAFPLP